jgi:UDP-N-acetylglucosamine--dolichyl-phosphate N-acetylglucosaminephosphotransferase
MRRRGIVGLDVHKTTKIEVPEMCGLAILLGLETACIASVVVFPDEWSYAMAFAGTILIGSVIGFIDDLRPLGPRTKPLLTALASIPILALRTYSSLPVIPLLGPVRLTFVYPLIIPVALAVTSNSVNMMDVMNGSMPGTVCVISLMSTIVLYVAGRSEMAALSAGLLGAMLAFYYFNRYPAKVFDGDTGSLAVGAALGAVAIMGGIEVVMMIALIPQIMNAFYGLTSVGKLYERREISQRPSSLREDGLLEANAAKGAPITLARLILAAGPLGERDVVRGMMFLTLISSLLAAATYWITLVGRV